MEMGGVDVRLRSWKGDEQEKLDPLVLEEGGRFAKRPDVWDLHLFSSALGGYKEMHQLFVDLQNNPGPQAFHCVFERQHIEPLLARDLNLLSSVWAQCTANKEVLERCGVQNVTLIHFPYFDDDPHLNLAVPKECRRFYWIGRFEPRKAPGNLIRAFMRAFKPTEATLTLKLSMHVHHKKHETPEGVILRELVRTDVIRNGWDVHNWFRSIKLVHERLSREEMVGIHRENDVYVSASRGEGLDLPAFAAKLAGRSLVLTDSGGPRDFLNEGDRLIPSTGVVPASADYSWGEDATYADYVLDDLIAAMQEVRASRPVGSRMLNKFRAEHVAVAFKKWVGGF